MVMEVDFDKLLEVKDDFLEYEDVLPLLIRAVIINKWSRNLNRKGLWVEINKKCVDTKPHTYNEAVKELSDWCKKNPEYKDLII